MSADLDALDRGVIDAGLVAAEALSQVKALRREVAKLRLQVELATRAEAILARAEYRELLAPPATAQRGRPAHLKAVPRQEASSERTV